MKPTIEDLICKHCGKPAKTAIYRNVEVGGTGWADVELSITENDEIKADVDQIVQEIQYDDFDRTERDWGCSNCATECYALEDLVELNSAHLDPVRWVQKHPLPGQERLPLTDNNIQQKEQT